MKTPMQELMDKVQSINERYEIKGDANWLMNEIIDLIESSLEKEKQHIMKAYKDCHDYMHIYGLDSEKYFNDEYKNK